MKNLVVRKNKSMLLANLWAILTALVVAPVHAATISVSSSADSGAGSLRQAISDAIAGDTIQLSSAVTLTSDQLTVTKNLSITGTGGNRTIARSSAGGTPEFRVIEVSGGATVTLTNLTLSNGDSSFGGGLYCFGVNSSAVLIDCTMSGNTAGTGGGLGLLGLNASAELTNCVVRNNTGITGAGIQNQAGTLSLITTTVSDNSASISGSAGGIDIAGVAVTTIDRSTIRNNSGLRGGIGHQGGPLTITSSTISGNTATSYGGGIFSSRPVTLRNSTISGNTCTGSGIFGNGGGAINHYGSSLTIESCTITGNSAPNVANGTRGGIWIEDGTVTVTNSIIARNGSGTSTQDIARDAGTLTNGGYNFIGDNTSIDTEFPEVAPNGSSYVGTAANPRNPLLGPLADNGGPTQTHGPLYLSRAINNGSTTLTTDQRGLPRIGVKDIGAFEVQVYYTLSGYVRTNNLTPLAGVSVQVGSSAGLSGTQITDASGFFRATAVPSGSYLLTPSLAGWSFSPTVQGVAVTNAGRAANFIGTRTAASYTINGRVSDGAGMAIPGVSVALTPATRGVAAPFLTNGAGYFTFSNVPNGTYTVTPSKAGTAFTPVNRSVTVSGGIVASQNFIGTTGYLLSGRVQTSRGIGIAGASVQLDGGVTVVSNGAGYYTFRDVADGTHSLGATLNGYTFTPAPKTVVVAGSNLSGQNITGLTAP